MSKDQYGYIRGSKEQYRANLKRCGASYPNPFARAVKGASNGK